MSDFWRHVETMHGSYTEPSISTYMHSLPDGSAMVMVVSKFNNQVTTSLAHAPAESLRERF